MLFKLMIKLLYLFIFHKVCILSLFWITISFIYWQGAVFIMMVFCFMSCFLFKLGGQNKKMGKKRCKYIQGHFIPFLQVRKLRHIKLFNDLYRKWKRKSCFTPMWHPLQESAGYAQSHCAKPRGWNALYAHRQTQ